MKIQKRPMSLLEVVIGLSLTAILLSSLFMTFRHISKESSVVQKAHGMVHERAILQLRVQQMFNAITEDSHLSCKESTLSFFYDHPYDQQAEFCGRLQGELLLSLDDFYLFSTNKENERREQKLFEHVSEIKWEFYNLKKKKWRSTPPKKQLPLQAKLHLLLENKEEYEFIFPLPMGGIR